MRSISDGDGARANEIAAANGHESSEVGTPSNRGRMLPDLWFAQMCRKLWLFKASAQLHFYTRRSDRTCRAWERGDNEPGATALADLIRSDEGWRVLKYVMRDSTATWWVVLQAAIGDLAKFAEPPGE